MDGKEVPGDDLAQQLDAVRTAVVKLYPGLRLRRLTLEFHEVEETFCVPMQGTVPGTPLHPEGEVSNGELTPMQEDILEVLDSMKPGESLSADEIVTKAGYGPFASGPARDFIKEVAADNGIRRAKKGWTKLRP